MLCNKFNQQIKPQPIRWHYPLINYLIISLAKQKHKFKNIKAKEKVDFELEITPNRTGQTTIVATFNANELYNIIGSRKISIIG